MTTGERLKKDLGLGKFRFVYIQKILNTSVKIYKITVHSRYPQIPIPISKTLSQVSTNLYRVNKEGEKYKKQEFRHAYPVNIEYFNGVIPSGSLIVVSDITGDTYSNTRMYEKVGKNNFVKWDTNLEKLIEEVGTNSMITIEFWLEEKELMIQYKTKNMKFKDFANKFSDEAYFIINSIYDYIAKNEMDFCDDYDNVFECIGNYIKENYLKYNNILDFMISSNGKVLKTDKEVQKESFTYKRKYSKVD